MSPRESPLRSVSSRDSGLYYITHDSLPNAQNSPASLTHPELNRLGHQSINSKFNPFYLIQWNTISHITIATLITRRWFSRNLQNLSLLTFHFPRIRWISFTGFCSSLHFFVSFVLSTPALVTLIRFTSKVFLYNLLLSYFIFLFLFRIILIGQCLKYHFYPNFV